MQMSMVRTRAFGFLIAVSPAGLVPYHCWADPAAATSRPVIAVQRDVDGDAVLDTIVFVRTSEGWLRSVYSGRTGHLQYFISPTSVIAPRTLLRTLRGDFTADGVVDADDLRLVLHRMGMSKSTPDALRMHQVESGAHEVFSMRDLLAVLSNLEAREQPDAPDVLRTGGELQPRAPYGGIIPGVGDCDPIFDPLCDPTGGAGGGPGDKGTCLALNCDGNDPGSGVDDDGGGGGGGGGDGSTGGGAPPGSTCEASALTFTQVLRAPEIDIWKSFLKTQAQRTPWINSLDFGFESSLKATLGVICCSSSGLPAEKHVFNGSVGVGVNASINLSPWNFEVSGSTYLRDPYTWVSFAKVSATINVGPTLQPSFSAGVDVNGVDVPSVAGCQGECVTLTGSANLDMALSIGGSADFNVIVGGPGTPWENCPSGFAFSAALQGQASTSITASGTYRANNCIDDSGPTGWMGGSGDIWWNRHQRASSNSSYRAWMERLAGNRQSVEVRRR